MEDDIQAPGYDVVIREHNGKFFAIIRELSVIGSGATIEEAYSDALEKKGKLVQVYHSADAVDHLPKPLLPHSSDVPIRAGATLKPYIITVLVLAVFGVGAVGIGRTFVSGLDRLEEGIRGVPKAVLSGHFVNKVDQELQRLAEKKLAPGQQQRMANNLRTVVETIRPFADEIKPLICDPPLSRASSQ